ncbi:MAG: GNAT family N-acetyltransferase [Gemmatimonadaceae bacterium]|nr:GNAT family N-acetyltransferase [Gemmatimonadaceae bacterium]NUP71441.1 GNAT family N-acetyltransferase [Gemmatimonadaceae bacterium]NUR35922.1 GNAT family N-acetyltransferase [Gemmatimonadaceae bacterium]NUT56213.1 GNAT family N-acetyltransferase [Thermoleophilia bacterium]
MHIGRLRPDHRGRLGELLVETGAFNADEVAVALALFDASQAALAAPASDADDSTDYEFVGAFEEERLVGYACFGATPATDGTYDLYWLAVDPAVQGRGIGRALVRDVEQQLVARGGRLLVVETSSRADYAATRQFYARSGYAEAARVRDFYAPADDRILLTTRLTTRDGGAATR